MAHWGIKITIPLTINPSWPIPGSFALTLSESLFDILVKANAQQQGKWQIKAKSPFLENSFLRGVKLSGGESELEYESYHFEVHSSYTGIFGNEYLKAMATAAGLFAANECRKKKLELKALTGLMRENLGQSPFAADCACALSGGIQYSYRIKKRINGFRIYCPAGLHVVLAQHGSSVEGVNGQTDLSRYSARLLPPVLHSLERFEADRLAKIYTNHSEEIFRNMFADDFDINKIDASSAIMFGYSTGSPLLYAIFKNSIDSDAFISALQNLDWKGQIIRAELRNTAAERQ